MVELFEMVHGRAVGKARKIATKSRLSLQAEKVHSGGRGRRREPGGGGE